MHAEQGSSKPKRQLEEDYRALPAHRKTEWQSLVQAYRSSGVAQPAAERPAGSSQDNAAPSSSTTSSTTVQTADLRIRRLHSKTAIAQHDVPESTSSGVAQPAATNLPQPARSEAVSLADGASRKRAASSDVGGGRAAKKLDHCRQRVSAKDSGGDTSISAVGTAAARKRPASATASKTLLLRLKRQFYDAIKDRRKLWEARPLFDSSGRQTIYDKLAVVGNAAVLQSGKNTNDRVRIAEVRRYIPQGLSCPLQDMVVELGADLLTDVADTRARAQIYEEW